MAHGHPPSQIPAAFTFVQLSQEVHLPPIVDGVFEALTAGYGQGPDPFLAFWKLSHGVVAFVRELSGSTAIAYVESDFSGNLGSQRAVV